jgi:ribosomal protein S18 acetylase RimI-like enzyme
MTWTVQPLPMLGPLFEGAIGVYGRAFAEPPYSDPDRGDEIRGRLQETHSHRIGFRAYTAVLQDGQVVGMIYGYRGAAGQWWHDMVGAQLSRDLAAKWTADSYELVEVAVDPEYQSQGIGEALIARLLEGCSEATCVLSTRIDSRAHVLYRRLGFEFVTEMAFAPRGAKFYIMGKRLK